MNPLKITYSTAVTNFMEINIDSHCEEAYIGPNCHPDIDAEVQSICNPALSPEGHPVHYM